MRDTQKLIAGAPPLHPGLLLFACAKRSNQEKAHPGPQPRQIRARFPPLLTNPGARLTRRSQTTRFGLDQEARENSRVCCGARLGTTGLEKSVGFRYAQPNLQDTKMHEQKVGLDSQCLSYLIDAASAATEPSDSLADERKALLRVWFYMPGRFYISETVASECEHIRNIDRRELHESFSRNSYWGMPVRNPIAVSVRAKQLMQIYPKQNDCRVLAEAEDLSLDTLLTYDHDFRKQLGSTSQTITIATPNIYWSSLGIPRGARPQRIPHPTNPLSQQSWWRW